MLIKNTSEIVRSIRLNLEFDDGTVKKQILSVGDQLELVFRRNCEKQTYVGTITNIGERVFSPVGRGPYNIAYIEFDYSADFCSRKLKIDLCDIIDFTFVASGDCDQDKPEDNTGNDNTPIVLPDGGILYKNLGLKVFVADDNDSSVVGKTRIAIKNVTPDLALTEQPKYPTVISKTREIITDSKNVTNESVKVNTDPVDVEVEIIESTHKIIGPSTTPGVPVKPAGYANYVDGAPDRQTAIGSSYGNTRY